jgi:hypothetical protein
LARLPSLKDDMNWMSGFLLILLGCTGYYAYQEYQQATDALSQVASLNNQLGTQKAQIDQDKKDLVTVLAEPVKIVHLIKIWTPPETIPAQPNWTLTTLDNKIHNNAVITKIDADCITVMDSTGGGLIPIGNLPDDLQKQLHYDPEIATFAVKQRLQNEQANSQLMTSEKDAYQSLLDQDEITEGIHQIWFQDLKEGHLFKETKAWAIATYKANDLLKLNCTDDQKKWLTFVGKVAGGYDADKEMGDQSITFLLDLDKLKNEMP